MTLPPAEGERARSSTQPRASASAASSGAFRVKALSENRSQKLRRCGPGIRLSITLLRRRVARRAHPVSDSGSRVSIRRRIETLLPLSLTGWARLATRLRSNVMDSLMPGPQRRSFWERFSDSAFTRKAPDDAAEAEARGWVEDLARSPSAGGRVTLVGPVSYTHLTLPTTPYV